MRIKLLSSVLSSCLSRLDGEGRTALRPLWKNWKDVLGPGLGDLARPLGQDGSALRVGAEDSMTLHELSYMAPEILDKVNAFLGHVRFDKVDLQLLNGRTPLDEIRIKRPDFIVAQAPMPELKSLPEIIPEDSPAGRAYKKYRDMFAAVAHITRQSLQQSHCPSFLPWSVSIAA